MKSSLLNDVPPLPVLTKANGTKIESNFAMVVKLTISTKGNPLHTKIITRIKIFKISTNVNHGPLDNFVLVYRGLTCWIL